MNTSELSKEFAVVTGLSVSKAEAVMRWLFGRITKEVASGQTVKIFNFGHFSYNERPARTGHNPATREPINIPAMKVAHWSVSVAVKEILNGKRDVATLFDGLDPTIVKATPAPATPAPAPATPAPAPATPAPAPAAPATPAPAPAAPAPAPATKPAAKPATKPKKGKKGQKGRPAAAPVAAPAPTAAPVADATPPPPPPPPSA